MNILYLTKSFPRPESHSTGIFNYFRYEELVKFGDEVTIVRPHHVRDRDNHRFYHLRKRYSLCNITGDDKFVESINYFQFPKTNRCINLLKPLYKIIKSNKIELVHAHFVSYAYGAYLLKKKYNIPYIVTCHGSDIHTKPMGNESYRRFMLEMLNNADNVIFVSKGLHEIAREYGYSQDNYTIIPNGIKKSLIEYSPRKKNDHYTIGFVGSLDDNKRAYLLPSIFYALNKKVKNVNFLIIGGGKYYSSIQDSLKKNGLLNNTIMTGAIPHDEVMNQFKKMEVLVLPSELEGFGCVILEANSKGVPVVASNNVGISEALGEGGVLVNDGENMIEEFAEKIKYILENPLSENELQRRVEKMTWEVIVKKERDVYRHVLKNKKINH